MTETTDNGPGPYDLRLRSLELALQYRAVTETPTDAVATAEKFYKYLNFDRSKS